MKHHQKQAKFYDSHPPLSPWPAYFARTGLSLLYKPREVFWKKHLDTLGISKNSRLLEVGSGQGIFLNRLYARYRARCYGVDISPRSVSYADRRFRSPRLSYLVGNATRLPFEDASFDFVVSFDVLEHVQDQPEAVREMLRVLKPGGKILIYTLNSNYRLTPDWFLEKLGIDIFARAAHKRELFIDPKALSQTITDLGATPLHLELFDAFFTLLLDEIIMLSLLLFQKARFFNFNSFGAAYLRFLSLLTHALYLPLHTLDRLWYSKGYSLSFVLIAAKNAKKKA